MKYDVHDPSIHDITEWSTIKADSAAEAILSHLRMANVDPSELADERFPMLAREVGANWMCLEVRVERDARVADAGMRFAIGGRWTGRKVTPPVKET